MSAHGEPVPMTARRGAALKGVADIPGDKSISHRALILGALSVGETRITGLLEGQDVLDTARAMAAFGAELHHDGPGAWRVFGVGVGGFAEQRLRGAATDGIKVGRMLHPSPASPAANRGWEPQALAQLVEQGIWTD